MVTEAFNAASLYEAKIGEINADIGIVVHKCADFYPQGLIAGFFFIQVADIMEFQSAGSVIF